MKTLWQKITTGKITESASWQVTAGNRFWLIFFAIVLSIMLIGLIPISSKNKELRNKIVNLEKEIKELRKKNTIYQKKIEALQKDPLYIEYLLRKKLRYGKKGEKVFRDGRMTNGGN